MVRSFNLSNYKNSIWRGRKYADLRYKKTETIPVEGTVVWWWLSMTFFSDFPLSTINDRLKFFLYRSLSRFSFSLCSVCLFWVFMFFVYFLISTLDFYKTLPNVAPCGSFNCKGKSPDATYGFLKEKL